MSDRKFRITEFKVTVIEEADEPNAPNFTSSVTAQMILRDNAVNDNHMIYAAPLSKKDFDANELAKQLIEWNYDPKELDLKPITTWE